MIEGSERRLRVAARLEHLAQARDFVAHAAHAAGLGEREVYHCEVAVDEAMTNIIEHGYGGRGDGLIDVLCVTEPGRFVITIIDGSPRFDPMTREDPDPTMTLDEREPGGWGIFFIKKMMDEVAYAYRDGRNYLTMVKVLPVTRPDRVEGGIVRREAVMGVWLLAPAGRLDSTSSPALEAALKDELKAEHAPLIVDMSRVTYIASSGLKVLVGAWRQAKGTGSEVILTGLQPRVQEVFQMVGFDQVFRIFATVEQAVEAVQIEEGFRS